MKPKKSKKPRPNPVAGTPCPRKSSGKRPYLRGMKTPWEEFYRFQNERLTGIVAGIGVPQDRIADVLQEVWLDLSKHHEGFEGEASESRLSAWLEIVVRSKAMQALRSLRRRREESLGDLPEETVRRETEAPEKVLEEEERDEQLTAQLEKLRKESPMNCRLLREHILGGRSLQDLSAETGLSVHAISCRISRALKMLRRWLRE